MKIKEFINKFSSNHILTGVMIAGILLRFYNFPNRYGFDFDAARDSLVASLFSDRLSFPLTGAASSVAPFNFGPLYYWGLIIFEKIVPIYGSWILVGALSVLTIIVAYKIGEKLENKNLGLILAGIFALSPSQLVLSTTLSNPSIIPFFSGLVILFFVSYLNTKKYEHVFFMTLFLSMGITIHFQLAGFIIFPVLILFFYKNRFKNTISAALGFLIPLIPIAIYDLNNNFYNLKGLIFYLTQSRENVYVANRWLFYVRDFWPNFISETLGLNLIISVLIVALLGILFIYLSYKKLLKKNHFMIILAFIFNFILLRYFPSQKPIYYLYFLQIFIFLFSGFLLFKIIEIKKIKPIVFLFSIFLIILISNKDRNILISESSNREVVKIKNALIDEYPENKFNVYFCDSKMNEIMGLTYLLNKQNLLSKDGKKVTLTSCSNTESVLDMHPDMLKNMQVYKSY